MEGCILKIRNKIISVFLVVFMLASIMSNFAISVSAEATSELQNIYYKLSVDKEAKIGYIGGSITQGYLATTPWPTLLGNWFAEKFPEAEITNVNAGIGGTGSMFGAYRAYRDLKISDGAPDMVFIEYAMNDAYLDMTEAQTKRYYESIIQRIYAANPKCQIVALFTTDIYSKGGSYDHKIWQKEIADYYGIKSIDIGETLWNAIVAENGSAPTDATNTVWLKYFNDYVHPTDAGHKIYADKIIEYLNEQLVGDTVTRDSTTYKALSKTAMGTDLITDGNSANFTEAGFYKAYIPGWILKATNATVENISNDILAYAGNAKLAFEFTGTSAGFYNESIGSNGNLTYTVTKKSDGTVVSQNTVNVNGRALTMFAEDLPSDTYHVEVVSDVNRRFRYVVYSGSSLEICKDTVSTDLNAADKEFNGALDQVLNMTQTSTTFGGRTASLFEANSSSEGVPYGQKWGLNYSNIFIPDYRYVKLNYYMEVPEGTNTTPQIGLNFTASPVDGGVGEGTGSDIVLKNAKTNMWATMVIDLYDTAYKYLETNPVYTNLRRYYLYPFGNVKASEVPADTKLYLESVTFMTNYESQEGAVKLSFVSGFADAQGTAPTTITGDTGDVITLPANTFSKDGYVFAGWGIDGTVYQPGEKFAVDAKGDYTANALWTKTDGSVTTGKVAYVSASGYIDSDGNGQPDILCYNSIDKAYEYFAEVGGEDTGVIYISGSVPIPNDTSAARGKVLIRGLGDTSSDIANVLTRGSTRLVLQEDLSFDYLTLSGLFGNEGFIPNGCKVTLGEHLKTDGNLTVEPALLLWDNDKGAYVVKAPKFVFNAPDITYGVVSVAKNGNIGYVTDTAEYEFNAGTFSSEIIAGSWLWLTNQTLGLDYNADYTFNGGSFNGNIYLGSRYNAGIAGNVVYTFNGGKFKSGNTVTFGHVNDSMGYAGYSKVKNSAVIFNNKQISLNGGSVNGLTVAHKTGGAEMAAEGAEIVVINNAEIDTGVVLSDALASTHRIKVMNGSAEPVFAEGTGGALLGFKLTPNNAKANTVYLNDTEITADANGLYQIAADTTAGTAGIRTVTFKQDIYALVDGEEMTATEQDGGYVINITKAGTVDLSNANCIDKDNSCFIGWKNASGSYVYTGDTVAADDVLYAAYTGTDVLAVSAKVVTSPSNAIRYTTSVNADAAGTLKEIDAAAEYGTVIISAAKMPAGEELTKETAGASVIKADVQNNSYYADSAAIADKDIENRMFIARGYVTYTDTLGETHTVYSDAVDKTLYQIAAAEYVDDATDSETKQSLLKNILDAAPRLGNPFSNTAKVIQRDKKLTIGYIGGSITNGYSAGSPSIRLKNQSDGKFNARWANGDEVTENDPRYEALGGLTNNWGNWNLNAMPMYYDENGVAYTKDNADFQDYKWNSTTGAYEAGAYFKVLPNDISKNWANRINGWFEEKFPGTKIESVNVGISGTPSSYGAARIENDLLYSEGHDVPDLVFIEFTINDWLYPDGSSTDGLTQTNEDLKRQVESMLISIWEANPYAEIALIYTAGETAATSQQHTMVANHYNIPYSDVGTRLYDIKRARLAKIRPDNASTWYENSANKDLYYTIDNLHPSIIGYGLYFEDIKEDLLDKYITNDMTYGTTLYNYAEANKELGPVEDWSMLNPTHILAEDFTWKGTQGEELAYTTGMWSINGSAWKTTVDCGYDYQKAPAVTGSMFFTERTNTSMNFEETPSSVHVTSDAAEASFAFTGRAFGFMFKTLYYNIDMEYRVDGGEWKKYRIASDNMFGSTLYENSNFVFAEQNLEQGYHTVDLKFNKSGGRINGPVTSATNEVNIYLGSAVYFSDTMPVSDTAEITEISAISETGLEVQMVAPHKAGAQIIAAVYDSNNELLEVAFDTINGSDMELNIAIPQTDGTTVKAMMWESIDGMEPICTAKTVVRENGEWVVK